ncbi:NAD(+)/NADH kinase, partial [Helcococcus ovis]
IPFIGINTGHLGFYNDVHHNEVAETIQKIKNNNYFIHNLRYIGSLTVKNRKIVCRH